MQPKDYQHQVVWIVGASSGIGKALAQELHHRGARLLLSARDQGALEDVNTLLGGHHGVYPLDVTNTDAVRSAAQAIHHTFGPLDRVIFMAAAYHPMKIATMEGNLMRQIIETNVVGAFNVTQAVIPLFEKQPSRGQLALCGSVAGYIGLPGGQPYSATKAAIINLAESLHGECQAFMDVKLINPGFVRTQLTDKNTFAMPMIMAPSQAATIIADGLLTKKFEIHFPKKLTLWLKLFRLLPYTLTLALLRKITT